MSRRIDTYKIGTNLEGQTIYFIREIWPKENGGDVAILGPYMNKPKIKNSRKAISAIETYILTKAND